MAQEKMTTNYESIKDYKSLKLEDFNEFKNPFFSQNPFENGQTLKFKGFTIASWSNSNGKNGKYIALEFEDTAAKLALSMPIKTAWGYTSARLEEDSEFSSKGGLHDVLGKFDALSVECLETIEKWFKEKERKVELTYYFLPYYGKPRQHSLTNVL